MISITNLLCITGYPGMLDVPDFVFPARIFQILLSDRIPNTHSLPSSLRRKGINDHVGHFVWTRSQGLYDLT